MVAGFIVSMWNTSAPSASNWSAIRRRWQRHQSISAQITAVFTARAVHERAGLNNLRMPITTEVYRVWYEGKDPRQAVQDLMLREPKSE